MFDGKTEEMGELSDRWVCMHTCAAQPLRTRGPRCLSWKRGWILENGTINGSHARSAMQQIVAGCAAER